MCCNHGKIALPSLQPPPPELSVLLTGSDVRAKNFKENICAYNRAFAFTSLGVKEDHSINRGNGPPVFHIQGELAHWSGTLLPEPGHSPVYAQLYIYDPSTAVGYRMANNSGSALRHDTMEILEDILRRNHQYAPIYLHAHEVLSQYPDTTDVSVHLRIAPGTDRRRYNLPTADEVAVILPTSIASSEPRDIILRRRGGILQRISDCHPAYAPLQYPLLFPYGENGWHPSLSGISSDSQDQEEDGESDRRITQSRFAAYRLHNRIAEFSCLLQGGRLFTRWLVDMYASLDQNRLLWLRLNQGKLRAALYSGLQDAINTLDGEVDLADLGQKVVLPSSYIGGPRHMQQQFQDSMAIARFFQKVDLFITVTTNPRWPEITQELRPGETPYDRPDLVARVFQLKKKAILDDIVKNGVLGKVAAYVYTIEFQKRGLPHMHCLIFLQNPDKLNSSEEIDKLISAQWPDPITQPMLFATIKSCMVHGPCGTANPRAPCMQAGKCTKHYPKPFCESTHLNDDGYPSYKRPDDGRTYDVGGIMVDNSWVVPYCPYLSAKYDCHINVECAASLGTFR
jgi:hypothetical protein